MLKLSQIGVHMALTTQVKESIKTALAMTIAYGIALALDWDSPIGQALR